MSDETTTVPEASDAGERTVPYSRFAEMNRRAKEAEQKLSEVTERISAIEERDQSEVQKVTKRAEKAEQERQELERRLVRVERSSWIRDAASSANFDDPADAVAFAGDLEDITSMDDASRFVKDLAKRKPRLLRPEDNAVPGQVLKNGQQVQGQQLPGQPAGDGQGLSDQDRGFLDQIQSAKEQRSEHSAPLFGQ